jgi:hypothetical protein
MQMIRHDHEFMEQVSLLFAIVFQHIHHQLRRALLTKQGRALPCNGCYEERAFKIHVEMVRMIVSVESDVITM